MKPLIATLIVCLSAAACDGQAKDANIPEKSTTLPPELALVDGVIAKPKLLSKPWQEMKAAFPAGCAQVSDSTELKCSPMQGVVRVSAMTGGLGLIDIVVTDPISCEDLYSLIAKRYGQGRLQDGDRCSADWNLSKSVKGAYIRISKSRKQADKIFMQFGIEQGP